MLPWASKTGWVLCDNYFPNGKPVPFCDADALSRCARASWRSWASVISPGSRSSFSCSRSIDPKLAPDTLTWPPEAPAVEHTTHGFQYLTESRFDQVEPILEVLRKAMQALGMPLRSLEVELGPSQYEFTFAPEPGLAAADTMVLFRSALKQVARRHGYLASLMCRPRLPQCVRQRLASAPVAARSRNRRRICFVSDDNTELLSPLGRHYLAGLVAHARAAAAFTTPTINGYKRYHGVNSMAPIQAIWANDNRGVMVRVIGAPGDPTTHLENRVGEPLANPYLYMASQIHAGLDGVARKLEPGPSADAPYEIKAEPLPKSLAEAVAALKDSACFRAGFGDGFVDYYARIKEAEIARCDSETGGQSGNADEVTAWEHKEYFDLA